MTRPALLLLVGGGLLAVLAGCHHHFTHGDFELVQVGVNDRADVRAMLGKPTSDLSDQWFYDDLKRHRTAVIFFDDEGRVSGKEWMDARSGNWEGRNPNVNPPPEGEVRERHKTTTRIDED